MCIQKYVESLIFVVRTSQNVYSKICWKLNIRCKDFKIYIQKYIESLIFVEKGFYKNGIVTCFSFSIA